VSPDSDNAADRNLIKWISEAPRFKIQTQPSPHTPCFEVYRCPERPSGQLLNSNHRELDINGSILDIHKLTTFFWVSLPSVVAPVAIARWSKRGYATEAGQSVLPERAGL
jgi:hypothetical protein